MSGGATAVMAAAAVAGAAISYQNGQEQKKAAEKASQQAERNALKQEKAADEANNRANQKKADPLAALNAAELSGRGGQSGTMLTGPQGVDVDALNLERSTLLGG
ncbi:MAG TPA: hypothetical protein GXX56_09040 [Rhodocyclaceae bacterium]|nr:hypothetical protein [Rhodocyclaceae bacterium]